MMSAETMWKLAVSLLIIELSPYLVFNMYRILSSLFKTIVMVFTEKGLVARILTALGLGLIFCGVVYLTYVGLTEFLNTFRRLMFE